MLVMSEFQKNFESSDATFLVVLWVCILCMVRGHLRDFDYVALIVLPCMWSPLPGAAQRLYSAAHVLAPFQQHKPLMLLICLKTLRMLSYHSHHRVPLQTILHLASPQQPIF